MREFISRDLYLGKMDNLNENIIDLATSKKQTKLYAINTDCMLQYWNNSEYQNILDKPENIVYVDGMGVIYAQKLLGMPVAEERIATTDLFPALIKMIAKNNNDTRVFLLGGKPGTAQKVKDKFNQEFNKDIIVGTHHGYFSKDNNKPILDQINKSSVDILFVGFGTPLQEKWVEKNSEYLPKVIITCGGLFDYYANNVKRAPVFMQKIGLEWLFRLMQEPKRLYKRYLIGNLKFAYRVSKLKFLNNVRVK